ncbi:MAG: uracil-DNA glycosylase family protein [Acidimicrobiales bacterium]
MGAFDEGYGREPFASLCRDYPGPEVYRPKDFRVEWGPVFHRGRLDGSARALVLGQDPGPHETVVRRILVGEAGQRVQGFLARLGVDRSYVMLNAFLYSVYGQGGGERNKDDPDIAAYRHRWLGALLDGTGVDVVVTFGRLAEHAFARWRQTPAGAAATVAHHALPHPTYPESASAAGQKRKADAMREMLGKWNEGLAALAPHVTRPDVPRPLVPYGEALTKDDLAPVPEADLPPGLPPWMRDLDAWAHRRGATTEEKRATLVVTVPRRHRS